MRKWGGLAEPTLCSVGRSVSKREVGRGGVPPPSCYAWHAPSAETAQWDDALPRAAKGRQYSRQERERERGQGRTELGRGRVSEEPLTPTEPQATSNKEIKWQFQRTQQLQECLSYVPLLPAPSPGRFPSLCPTQHTLPHSLCATCRSRRSTTNCCICVHDAQLRVCSPLPASPSPPPSPLALTIRPVPVPLPISLPCRASFSI